MARHKVGSGTTEASSEMVAVPRSLAIAQRGIKTGADFAEMMSALMSDLVEGAVTPQVGNATCNAGGKLLKMVELGYKYGNRMKGDDGVPALRLTPGDE